MTAALDYFLAVSPGHGATPVTADPTFRLGPGEAEAPMVKATAIGVSRCPAPPPTSPNALGSSAKRTGPPGRHATRPGDQEGPRSAQPIALRRAI